MKARRPTRSGSISSFIHGHEDHAVKIPRLTHCGKKTNLTRAEIESEDYIYNAVESNLAFLRTIPNSTWDWLSRKKDLFAMIRQIGKPTIFLTISANEIGWYGLLQLLYKLRNNGAEISEKDAELLHFMEKSTLINEDAVTCAIYFNKLINVLLSILQSARFSPFGRNYRVLHYFKRIEFQHRGSPHAHILLWLHNAPQDILGQHNADAVKLCDSLISVSAAEASGNIKLQTHKHTVTCNKKIVSNGPQKCRFEAPFMPCQSSYILTPMPKTDPLFKDYSARYKTIREHLEENDYADIDELYQEHGIASDEEYVSILQAGITRPRIFYKRLTSEKWHNPFNPLILSILKSNMDIQLITEEY